jgi:spoIIIJ-associated protein
MEWVETTGKTVEEAKDAALDQLGVDDGDAEFEVLEEPTTGLFGRQRGEARVRARVRPTTPRPKVERRGRRKPSGGKGKEDAPVTTDDVGEAGDANDADDVAAPEPAEETPPRGSRPAAREPRAPRPVAEPATGEEIAQVRTFLEGLVDAFGAEATVTFTTGEDDAIEAHVNGDDLGLLIGPKAQTLTAIQELARAVLQKDGPGGPRLRVDVGGYRERRKLALERFTRTVAEQVLASGTPTSMEPMSAADRKVVHDTANGIDGVHTISEGEDPRRRVVLLPGEG